MHPDEKAAHLAEPMAFERLYCQWVGPVYRFCLSQLRDARLAEDATADVFAAALAAYARTAPDQGVGMWIFRIARNRVVDEHRGRRRRQRVIDRLRQVPRAATDPVDAVSMRDDVRRAGEAIARLRPRERELVGLRVAAQLSYAEIAALVGMKETAAKVATHRAFKRVRQWMEEGAP
jgi:RNA polymerase sigma factor (sigma-70 family)